MKDKKPGKKKQRLAATRLARRARGWSATACGDLFAGCDCNPVCPLQLGFAARAAGTDPADQCR